MTNSNVSVESGDLSSLQASQGHSAEGESSFSRVLAYASPMQVNAVQDSVSAARFSERISSMAWFLFWVPFIGVIPALIATVIAVRVFWISLKTKKERALQRRFVANILICGAAVAFSAYFAYAVVWFGYVVWVGWQLSQL